MNKIIFSSLMLMGAAASADSTPTFDFNSGILNMPYVSTAQGAYAATLQISPVTPPTTFSITQVGGATVANTDSAAPTFDFNSGLLTLPKVNTANGIYQATLQLSQNIFTLTNVGAYASQNPGSGACQLFPANNVWNTPVNNLPLHPFSAAWIGSISTRGLHPDFGNANGQPINVINGSTAPKYTFTFQYPAESDVGPYPIPSNYLIQKTEDNLLLTLDKEACYLYEVYNARNANNVWTGRRGAIWNLNSNALRPLGLGSADEAGLPITPGLVRFDEVAAGAINHAIRFTFPNPSSGIWPARHIFGNYVPVNNTMPMGAHLRLKGGFDISGFDPQVQVILQAMKTYGIILADTGSSLYISGTEDTSWNDDVLHALGRVTGSNFEAVNSECMMVDPNSGEANPNQC